MRIRRSLVDRNGRRLLSHTQSRAYRESLLNRYKHRKLAYSDLDMDIDYALVSPSDVFSRNTELKVEEQSFQQLVHIVETLRPKLSTLYNLCEQLLDWLDKLYKEDNFTYGYVHHRVQSVQYYTDGFIVALAEIDSIIEVIEENDNTATYGLLLELDYYLGQARSCVIGLDYATAHVERRVKEQKARALLERIRKEAEPLDAIFEPVLYALVPGSNQWMLKIDGYDDPRFVEARE